MGEEFFAAHSTQGKSYDLDMTKFLDAQGILASVLGEDLDSASAASAFMKLIAGLMRKGASPRSLFIEWQLDSLASRRLSREKMTDVLTSCVQKLRIRTEKVDPRAEARKVK